MDIYKELENLGFYPYEENIDEMVFERLGPKYDSDYIIFDKNTGLVSVQLLEHDEDLEMKLSIIFASLLEGDYYV